MTLTLEKARELLKKYLHVSHNRIHSRESEVVLRALARRFNEDEEKWGIAGLLHDLDWEETAEDFPRHGLRILEILESEGVELPDDSLHAIRSHNFGYNGVSRETKFDFALAAGETVTGLIYAYARMRPEKLAGMKASSLNKKFKDKSFAATCSRETINEIEKAGLPRAEFFALAIEAIQSIEDEIEF